MARGVGGELDCLMQVKVTGITSSASSGMLRRGVGLLVLLGPRRRIVVRVARVHALRNAPPGPCA